MDSLQTVPQTRELPLGLRIKSAFAHLMMKMYFPAIFAGLAKTMQWILRPKVTEEYPEVRPVLKKGYRGEHRLKKDEQGRPKCVACYMCQTACPAECIEITAGVSPYPDRPDKIPVEFRIDLLKCIYCGMCEEACPCDAIELTEVYTQVSTTREEKVYDIKRLLSN